MLPIRDSNPTGKFPLVTYALIALNVLVFILELTAANPDRFIARFALIPANVDFGNLASLYPFITSQFLHAGFVHIISNMWFLKIFGDNVEERFGRLPFAAIYLISGIVAGLAQYLLAPSSPIPMLGASGAVAGVLGAYFVFFPRHTVDTIVPVGGVSRMVQMPASAMLLYWFVTQLFSGVGAIASAAEGGVAWWAHVGGFAAGWIFAQIAGGLGRGRQSYSV